MHGVGVGGGMHRHGGDAELLAARRMRSAISPRLAIRILSNMDRRAVFDQDLRHGTGPRRRDLVHGLHRLDDDQRLSGSNLGADFDEGRLAGLRGAVDGADHRRGHGARMLGHVGGGRCGSSCGDRRGCSSRCGRISWHSGSNADVTRDAHAQTGALDLDLGEVGFIQQQRQFADHAAIVAGFRRCGLCVVRLAGHGQSNV
jgi:hypothetical protein